MNALTEYLDTPLTQALAASFGAKLERLTAQDKLDIAQTLLTQIAYNDQNTDNKTVAGTAEAFGAVYPDAPNTDAVASIVDAHPSSVEDRLGLAAALCHQLHKGGYADA
jgi:thioredoxin-like negative regulator of GroEL